MMRLTSIGCNKRDALMDVGQAPASRSRKRCHPNQIANKTCQSTSSQTDVDRKQSCQMSMYWMVLLFSSAAWMATKSAQSVMAANSMQGAINSPDFLAQRASLSPAMDPILRRLKKQFAERKLISNTTAARGMVPCPSDSSVSGYTSIGSLQQDILFTSLSNFLLCPNINFTSILIVQPPILTSNLTLKCASKTDPCVWSGGTQQLVIMGRSGPLLDVRVEGITFRDAQAVSTTFRRSPSANVRVEFVNCRWERNLGPATVWIMPVATTSKTTRRLVSFASGRQRRPKPSSKGFTITFTRCIFLQNRGSIVLAIDTPSLTTKRQLLLSRLSTQQISASDVTTINNCTFRSNEVDNAVINNWYATLGMRATLLVSNNARTGSIIKNSNGGSLVFTSTKFIGNTLRGPLGLVATVAQTGLTVTTTCTSNNTVIGIPADSCNGVSIGPDPLSCSGINASNPECQGTCRVLADCFKTSRPTQSPTLMPSATPTNSVSGTPSQVSSSSPTAVQSSGTPSISPYAMPSFFPSIIPSVSATTIPSQQPSDSLSGTPSTTPTLSSSTGSPSVVPSSFASLPPSTVPSDMASASPSFDPTGFVTLIPSVASSRHRRTRPPSSRPSSSDSLPPSLAPSISGGPTLTAFVFPTLSPSLSPTVATKIPSHRPAAPSRPPIQKKPSKRPTRRPSTRAPTPVALPSHRPSKVPELESAFPSSVASESPSTSTSSTFPSLGLSEIPTQFQSRFPSRSPSMQPSVAPSFQFLPSSILPGIQRPHPEPSQESKPSHFPSLRPSIVPFQEPTFRPSILNRTMGCISSWENLYEAVNSTIDESVVICPQSAFNLTKYQEIGLAPLVMQSSILSLKCGSDGSKTNSCVFEGGQNQIMLKQSRTKLTIEGITFRGATNVSVVVKGASPFLVEFADCLFDKASGTSAIQVSPLNGPQATNNDDVLATDTLTRFRELAQSQKQYTAVVGIRACTFTENRVFGSLVENNGGAVEVTLSTFTDNVVRDSVLANTVGTLDVTSSCFSSNAYNPEKGLVLGSSVSHADNFRVNNTPGCEGIAHADGKCVAFDSTTCKASQTPSPSAAPQSLVDCYSDWNELSKSVKSYTESKKMAIFNICPGTSFDLDMQSNKALVPMVISSDVVIQCGSSGNPADNCIISGSSSHFTISGNTTTVELKGLRMERASVTSIVASGGPSAQLAISNCEFQNNTGLAVVLIDHKGTADTEILQSGNSSKSFTSDTTPSMSVTFTECLFARNLVNISTIVNNGGSTSLIRTAVVDSRGGAAGVVSVIGAGSLALSNSCFVNISKTPRGIVYLGQGSILSSNVNTSGYAIPSRQDTCNAIFVAQQGSCITSLECKGGCVPFTSRTCSLPELSSNATSPPIAPTAPTVLPTEPPSSLPTGAGVNGSQQIASYEPITIKQKSFGRSTVFIANFGIALALMAGGAAAFYFLQTKGIASNG